MNYYQKIHVFVRYTLLNQHTGTRIQHKQSQEYNTNSQGNLLKPPERMSLILKMFLLPHQASDSSGKMQDILGHGDHITKMN